MPHYCNNADLQKLVRKAKRTKKLPDEMVVIISQIMKGLHGRTKFKLSQEDMIAEALLLITQKIKNLDDKGNCFSYITTCCLNLLRQQWRREQHQNNIKANYYKKLLSEHKLD